MLFQTRKVARYFVLFFNQSIGESHSQVVLLNDTGLGSFSTNQKSISKQGLWQNHMIGQSH